MITSIRRLELSRAAALLGVVGLALLGQACRSKLDVQSKDGGPMPQAPVEEAPPVEEPDPVGPTPVDDPVDPKPQDPVEKKAAMALKGGKLYFQTRDTITIEIKKEVIEGAPTFSLLNITNSGKDDSKAVKIVEEAVPKFGLYEEGFGLAELSGDQVQLQFYPGDNQWKGKFFYGKNILKVVANDDANPRYSVVELYLQDFDVFGVAVTSFAENVQVMKQDGPNGYQFQGWVNILSPPTVATADKKSVLTNGIFNMVNPQ